MEWKVLRAFIFCVLNIYMCFYWHRSKIIYLFYDSDILYVFFGAQRRKKKVKSERWTKRNFFYSYFLILNFIFSKEVHGMLCERSGVWNQFNTWSKKRRPKKNIIQFTCGVGECNLLLNFNNTIVIWMRRDIA